MKGRRFIPLLVVAAGLLAYCNSFTGTFVHDDFGSIAENPTIQKLWPIWECLSPSPLHYWITVEGRPLINLSLAINYALGGYNVWGYHALNLIVHILAGLTLFGIVRRTLLRMPGTAAQERSPTNGRPRWNAGDAVLVALAVAVLWTVHPLQTESVTYIIQRAESIMGLFYLLTLYCFIRGTESPRARLWYSLSVAACALGMASKEVMVSAPLMVLLYDRAFLSRSFREAWRRRLPLYLGLAGTWVVLAVVLISAGIFGYASMTAQQMTRWQYLATEPGVILYYLRLSVWPSPLSLEHTWPIASTWARILPPAVVVVGLLAATVWAWRRSPVWGFVGAWFFLILAPSSSVIPIIDPMYEHRMYLSLAAVVSILVIGLYLLVGRRSLAVLMVAAVGLGFLTWRQNQHYRRNPHYTLAGALAKAGRLQESITEYEQALRITPDDPETHYNLGLALRQIGRGQEAVGHMEQALRITPGYPEGHYDLGVALMGLGRTQEAVEQLEEAVRLKPDLAAAHNNLGVSLARLGRIPEAMAHWEQTVRIDPTHAQAHNNLGLALVQLGKVPEAIGHWEQALRVDPNYAEAHYNLGLALMGLGRVPEAIAHWEQAVRIKPNYAEAHNNLGDALAKLGRVSEAIGHWEQALRIVPNLAEAHYNLGVAFEQMGHAQEAIDHYEQALRINPNYAEAKNNLARARLAR